MDDKILDKIQKLSAHAESAEQIGNVAEAQAFATKVQAMLFQHKLSMAEVKGFRPPDDIGVVPLDWEKYGLKVKQARCQWADQLAGIVASANFCRLMCSRHSNALTFIGHKEDCEVTEYLFIVMFRAAEKIAEKAYCKEFYRCRDRGDVKAARGFKAAFLDAFVNRIFERFGELKTQQEKEGWAAKEEKTSNALTIVKDTQVEVDDWMGKNLSTSRIGNRAPRVHVAGTTQGRAMADSVSLKANAIKESSGRPLPRRLRSL
ncbi:hypothetical protein LCGC14_2124670 [marine sediment metagenome]|uniref:Uncharacterized protein n=1 Tax=marine sediment metagenome TaxID=412755 RepID=A0A0F9E398_9ZZZZ